MLIAKCRLLHYFESHHIMVVMSATLGEIIQNQDTSGRVAKWAMELMRHHVTYVPMGGDQVADPSQVHVE